MLTLLLALALQDPVGTLIEKLAHEDPEVRDAAAAELLKLGQAALEPLRRAMKAESKDIAGRAARLVDELEWPEPGAPMNGLAMAIRAAKEYPEKDRIMLRGRLINVSDADITLTGMDVTGESAVFLLTMEGRERDLHLCYHRTEPAPDVPAQITIKKGGRLDFTFSPRAWCGSTEHSKCTTLGVTAGERKLSIALQLNKRDGWTGRVASNDVRFTVKP
jgi:hypothetical protein